MYKHFETPIILKENRKVRYKFVCKKSVSSPISTIDEAEVKSRSPSISLVRDRYEDSTANLNRHVKQCNPDETPSSQQMTAFTNGTTYAPARFRYLLAMWCARRHRPFNIVKDDELIEIFRMLYDRVDVPHPITVSRDVKEIFSLCKENVANYLQVILFL
jgi:hypothetical protein